jgi:hypothetical protein
MVANYPLPDAGTIEGKTERDALFARRMKPSVDIVRRQLQACRSDNATNRNHQSARQNQQAYGALNSTALQPKSLRFEIQENTMRGYYQLSEVPTLLTIRAKAQTQETIKGRQPLRLLVTMLYEEIELLKSGLLMHCGCCRREYFCCSRYVVMVILLTVM